MYVWKPCCENIQVLSFIILAYWTSKHPQEPGRAQTTVAQVKSSHMRMANIQHISSHSRFPHSLQTSLISPAPHLPEPEGSLRILLSISSRQPLPNNLKQNQKWIFWYFCCPVSSFSVIFVNTAVFPGWSLTLMTCIFWLTWPWPSSTRM